MSIKAVIFDLGSTLIYFDGDFPEVARDADEQLLAHLQEQGMQLDPGQFLGEFRKRLNDYYVQRDTEFVEHTTNYILRTLLAELGYPNVSEEALHSALERLYAVSQEYWLAEEDTLPTLEALRQAGYRMGIISNAADDADVQTLVDKAQVRPYMDFVLSSAACGVRKPNPAIFKIAMKNWDFEPQEVAMVGDTLGADILGAYFAGLYSVWITRRADKAGNHDHLDTIQPNASIATLGELPELLAGLNA